MVRGGAARGLMEESVTWLHRIFSYEWYEDPLISLKNPAIHPEKRTFKCLENLRIKFTDHGKFDYADYADYVRPCVRNSGRRLESMASMATMFIGINDDQ